MKIKIPFTNLVIYFNRDSDEEYLLSEIVDEISYKELSPNMHTVAVALANMQETSPDLLQLHGISEVEKANAWSRDNWYKIFELMNE